MIGSNNITKNKIATHQNYSDKIVLFFCGFFVFSPLSSYISSDILHLPFALPELLFLPFYFKLRKLFDLKVNMKIFIVGLFVMLLLFAISLLNGLFPLSSILSTTRGYFYMLLVFSIFKNKNMRDINYLFYITFGSSTAWMILSISSVNQIMNATYIGESFAVYGNMIALALMIAISIIFKNKTVQFFVLAITLVISITAGLRRQISVALIAFVLSFLTQIKLSVKRILSLTLSLLILTFIIVALYPIAKEFTNNVSPTLHHRIFVKSEVLVTGDITGGDQTRYNSFTTFINEIEEYILPRGFVSKRTMQDEGAGLLMDSPYIELFHMFGIVLSIPILVYLFLSLFFHFKNYYKRNVKESAVCLVMGGVILLLFLIEGSFLNFTFATPLTGVVIARLASRKNLIIN